MKRKKQILLVVAIAILTSCTSIKLTLNTNNLSENDMVVEVESYNKKGNLKRSPSYNALGRDSLEKSKATEYVIAAFKGGVVKMNYKPSSSQTSFNLKEIHVPNSNQDFERAIGLSDVRSYNEEDEKKSYSQLQLNLNLKRGKNYIG